MISFNNIVLPDESWSVIWGSQNHSEIIAEFPSVAFAYAFACLEAPKWERRDPLMYSLWLAIKWRTWEQLLQSNQDH